MLHNSRRRCAKVQIPDEELDRYDATVIGTRLIALANTLTRKIDQLAIAAIEAALTKYSIAGVPGHHWGELVTVGLFDSITPNAERPVANISNIALFARVDDLDIKPTRHTGAVPAAELQIGYGAELTAVLAAVGIEEVRTSVQVTNGHRLRRIVRLGRSLGI